MAANFDLNFVNSDVDLSTVQPLDRRQLVTSLNEWLLRAADTLNAFAGRAESRLLVSEAKLDAVDVQLQLLERKLANVSDGVPLASEIPQSSNEFAENQTPLLQLEDQPDSNEIPPKEPNTVHERSDLAVAGTVALRDHPRYVKYFTMLRIGIADAAVRQKMIIDGLDSTVLSRPNERVVVNTTPTNRRPSSSSSAGSFDSI